MKNSFLFFTFLLLAVFSFAQAKGVRPAAAPKKAPAEAQKPLKVKDAAALEKLLLQGDKAAKYSLGTAKIGTNSLFFWLYPKSWIQEKTPYKSAYEIPTHNPEAVIIEVIDNKLDFLNAMAEESKIINEGEVDLLGKKLTNYKYIDKDDPSLATDAYIYKTEGALIGFTIITPSTIPVTFVMSDIINNSGVAVFADDKTEVSAAQDIASVEISAPDLKNMQTIKFPEGQKFFSAVAPASLTPELREGRIYFNCTSSDCASLMFLQKFDGKITKEQHEAALSKNLGQLKRSYAKTETFGRLKANISKKEYKATTITNYYFTSSEPFVLSIVAETKNDRKLNAVAADILRSARLTDK